VCWSRVCVGPCVRPLSHRKRGPSRVARDAFLSCKPLFGYDPPTGVAHFLFRFNVCLFVMCAVSHARHGFGNAHTSRPPYCHPPSSQSESVKAVLEQLIDRPDAFQSLHVCSFLHLSASTFDPFPEPPVIEGPVRIRRRWHRWVPDPGFTLLDVGCCRLSAKCGFQASWHRRW